MNQSHTAVPRADCSEPVKAGTVRELVVALAGIEDQLRHLETVPHAERGPEWRSTRATLAEQERSICEVLHSHGLGFKAYPHEGDADRSLGVRTVDTATEPAVGAANMPDRPSPE